MLNKRKNPFRKEEVSGANIISSILSITPRQHEATSTVR